jgi:carbamoyltransferase
MKILGISHDLYITSACLLEDGHIVAACPEERLDRIKLSTDFPVRAIDYCLREAGCSLADVDHVAVGWNPGGHINKLNTRFSARSRWRGEHLTSVPNFLLGIQDDERVLHIRQQLTTESAEIEIVFVDHHKAHAGHFFLSPFEEAAIMTCDGRGEHDTVTLGQGAGHSITELQREVFPQSLGMLYGTITQLLGYRRDSDEWKVMALASYWPEGAENPYLGKMRKLIRLLPEGRFELDLTYFSYYLYDVKRWYNDKLVSELGAPRGKDDPIKEHHHQIAHALQVVTEEATAHVLHDLHRRTGLRDLVVCGGSFMNSVFNGKITELTPFERVFISSCADDSGVALGAATYVYNHLLERPEREEMVHNYYGPEYSDGEIRETLDRYKLRYQKPECVEAWTAQRLAEGRIVGWMQGRMEFGQRALGNRSILADPRDVAMKDRVNLAVKYRESFRPFAPAVLEEHVDEYFQVKGERCVRFMERVYPVCEEKRAEIPAVVHVDGSGRLQTVERAINPRFHRLISEFKQLTGVPVLMNTSFNLNGEPIVCSPTDAIRTFHSCGLDVLVLGDCVLEK